MPISPNVARLRSMYANASLRGDEPAKLTTRRDLKAAVAGEYIQKLVDSEPMLTPEQRERLIALLRDVTQPAAAR